MFKLDLNWQETVKAGTKVTARVIDVENRGRRIIISINGKDFADEEQILKVIKMAKKQLLYQEHDK